MPEGDTIHRLAAKVRTTVGGRQATWSTFRHPRLATLDVAGRTLVDATSYGKHLFLHWDDGRSLHIHLLMQGAVRLGGGPAPVEEWRRRFEIRFDDGTVMTGVDIPLLHLVRTESTERVVDHLGPDLCGALSPDDLTVVVAKLGADGDQPLGGALLDQRNVAGFGNIYAVEVPHICGVSPLHPVGMIEGLDSLVAVGTALIRANAELGPQNTTGKRLHVDEHWVLDGNIRACKHCGARLKRLNGQQTPWRRRTAWCSTCQPDGHGRVDVPRIKRLLALHPARRLIDYPDEPGGEVSFTGPPERPKARSR
jgi:endonuclease-8